MKTLLMFSIAFAAGAIAARAQQFDPSINTNATWRTQGPAFIFQPDSINEIKRGRANQD